jgi:hypothetical protein
MKWIKSSMFNSIIERQVKLYLLFQEMLFCCMYVPPLLDADQYISYEALSIQYQPPFLYMILPLKTCNSRNCLLEALNIKHGNGFESFIDRLLFFAKYQIKMFCLSNPESWAEYQMKILCLSNQGSHDSKS